MNLFKRKAHTVLMCNLVVPFVCTGFLGIKNYNEVITGSTTDEAHEISLTEDTEPVSQYWEGEEDTFAFITEGVEAIIGQQDDADSQEIEGEEDAFAFITEGVEAIISQQEKALAEKKEEKKVVKSTAKKTTKKTTNNGTKKETTVTTYNKPSSKTGEAVVAFAKQFLGLRYKSGTPSLTNGADCSGFTMLVYREFGVSLPRNVAGQMGRGTAVSKSNLQKGDLVFYRACKKCKVSHVGIYAGGGQVIHESKPGVGVKYSTVNMMYYAGARRVINSNAVKIAEQKLADQKKEEAKTDTTSNTANNTNTIDTNAVVNDDKKEENINNNVVENTNVVDTTTTVETPKEEVKQEVVTTDTPKEETKVETAKVEEKEEPKKEEVVESNNTTAESN